jgi:small subunit ribosomal protein S13
MARIAGVDLPNTKRVDIALTAIFGIGQRTAAKIVAKAGVDKNKKAGDLDSNDVNALRQIIDQTCVVEGDLRRTISMAIKRLVDLGTYRGSRHRKSLPVRGQRSRTNARTRKGPRKTIAGKKKAPVSK